ncbi:hypothetical protein SNQ23_002670 [Cronobacter dublinensis]|uniref:hypothetical protein n=1 Tax=Cronobacter dublinensis TaxID=413497 RepID=UPI0024AD9B04|nr:hypothetical protein [Cronobacter dublinensis]ELY6212824.1 hypothetical protein [Cronobacter dublinensis]EMD9247333.1 hypothetical protein [Cronobacter dublinensis]MDI6444578.1 hypothetical protein [Cronobacter dublinensis]
MLKKFTWKENDLYLVQLKEDLFIIAQLLVKPYVAFFDVAVSSSETDKVQIDLSLMQPMGTCAVLKSFIKKCAVAKINRGIKVAHNLEVPEFFISPDKAQWLYKSDFKDDQLKYNLVHIDPKTGDQGIMGNEIIMADIKNNEPELFDKYELVGYNTGYELLRRLVLSVEKKRWIDPQKSKILSGNDEYALKTLDELFAAGVIKIE